MFVLMENDPKEKDNIIEKKKKKVQNDQFGHSNINT